MLWTLLNSGEPIIQTIFLPRGTNLESRLRGKSPKRMTRLLMGLCVTTNRSRILSATGSIVYLVFAISAYWIIERWGRRTVIMVSSFGCALCWTVIAIMQGLTSTTQPTTVLKHTYGVVSVVFFFVFWAAFGMGLLPVPWIYPTEINALEKRTTGAAIAVATNWICNYMVAEVTPVGIANLGWKFWIIWAVICASFIPIVYFLFPETANRSLEDIDRFFETNPPILVHRNQLAVQLKRPEVFWSEDERVGSGKTTRLTALAHTSNQGVKKKQPDNEEQVRMAKAG